MTQITKDHYLLDPQTAWVSWFAMPKLEKETLTSSLISYGKIQFNNAFIYSNGSEDAYGKLMIQILQARTLHIDYVVVMKVDLAREKTFWKLNYYEYSRRWNKIVQPTTSDQRKIWNQAMSSCHLNNVYCCGLIT